MDDAGDAVRRLQQELAFAHQRCVQPAAASRLIEHLIPSSLLSGHLRIEVAHHVHTVECPEHSGCFGLAAWMRTSGGTSIQSDASLMCRADEAAQRGQGLHGAAEQLRDENGRLASQLSHLRAQLDRTSSELNAKAAGGAAALPAPSPPAVAATLPAIGWPCRGWKW